MTDVLQCPYCVLRFSTQSELDHHKQFDHPDPAAEERTDVEAAPITSESSQERAEPEPEKKRGWFKRVFGGG